MKHVGSTWSAVCANTRGDHANITWTSLNFSLTTVSHPATSSSDIGSMKHVFAPNWSEIKVG